MAKSTGKLPTRSAVDTRRDRPTNDGGQVVAKSFMAIRNPAEKKIVIQELLEDYSEGLTMTEACAKDPRRPKLMTVMMWNNGINKPPYPEYADEYEIARATHRQLNADLYLKIAREEVFTTETTVIQQEITLHDPTNRGVAVPATSRRTVIRKRDNTDRTKMILWAMEKREAQFNYSDKQREEKLLREAQAAVAEGNLNEPPRTIIVIEGTNLPD